MAQATQQAAGKKSQPRKPAIGRGWRTTDVDEVERRRRRATSEAPQVRAHGRSFYGVYTVQSVSGRSHRVEFRSADKPINSCDCLDYEVNGLGTCKHVEAVRQHVGDRRAPARRTVTEIHLDRSDQYDQGPVIRALWANRLKTDDPVRQVLEPFFGADDCLVGEPATTIPALRRVLHEAAVEPKQLRVDSTSKCNASAFL